MLWPVLLPIHATGGGHAKELDALNFGNVTNPRSFYAHVVMSALFFAFVFYMVIRESIFYASLRQAYLLSPLAANRLSSRTVLFMSVPKSYLSKHKLEEVFGQDIVQRIWIVPRSSKLNRLAGKRDRLAFRLEYFETKLVKEANMARIRYMQKNARHLQSQPSDLEAIQVDQDNFVLDPTSSPWAPEVRRPRTYVRGKGLVDAIGHYRACLEGLIPRIARLQRRCQLNKTKCVSAAFIEFKTQGDAQLAYQSLAHYQPFAMSPRYIGIPPQQILWHSLKQSWLQRVIRKFVIQGAIATLIIFWSIPSAFIGTISNIDYLAETVPFLHFVENLPGVIKTIISGVLPAAALALLMSAVPAILQCKSTHTVVLSNVSLTPFHSSSFASNGRAIRCQSRAFHAECQFLFPVGTGLSGNDINIGGIRCRRFNYQRSPFAQRPFSFEPPQSFEFLRLVFFDPGHVYEYAGACSTIYIRGLCHYAHAV